MAFTPVGIAALLGNLCQDFLMILMGGVIMFAGLLALVDYYVTVEGMGAIEIFTALGVSFFVYPVLRMYILKPRYHDARITINQS